MLTPEQIRYRIRENNQAIKFAKQAILAERLRAELDDPIAARLRAVERENYWLRLLRDEQAQNGD